MNNVSDPFLYESNATFADLAGRIHQSNRILLTTHGKPDGDAMGSMLALHRAISGPGRSVEIWIMGPLESSLERIAGETPFNLVEAGHPTDEYDLIIVCDTGAWVQLEPLSDWLRDRYDRIFVVDHHVRGEDVGACRIVDSSKASATQMLVELMDELGVDLTGEVGGVAEALFVGLATDTGWFKFQNAEAEAFKAAARLLDAGIDKSRLYQIIEETAQPTRLALQAKALGSLQYARGGEVAIMSLSMDDFKSTGGSLEELTGIVNEPMRVGAVRVSILLSQTKPGLTKLSFRAKPSMDGATFTDVNLLAQQFNGGGHTHAAGAKLEMDLEGALQTVLTALEA